MVLYYWKTEQHLITIKVDFLFQSVDDILILLKKIKEQDIKLKVVLDIDQLLTTLQERPQIRAICHALKKFSPYKSLILGFHIHWKHRGDLNNLFPNPEEKEDFLKFMSQYCNDGIPRYFLPEIHFWIK